MVVQFVRAVLTTGKAPQMKNQALSRRRDDFARIPRALTTTLSTLLLAFPLSACTSSAGVESYASNERTDTIADSLAVTTAPLPTVITGSPATVLLQDGQALVIGVQQGGAVIYSPATNTWAVTGQLAFPSAGHQALRLSDGKILVSGGIDPSSTSTRTANSAVYDPTTGAWSYVGSMTRPRSGHATTLLADGRVFAAGGAADVNDAEIYNPGTKQWTTVAGWTGPVHGMVTSTRLVSGPHSGKVLVRYDDVSFLFDPSAAFSTAWTPIPIWSPARRGQRAVLLGDGRVLVAGGDVNPFGVSTSTKFVELFDPITASWSMTGSLSYGMPANGGQLVALPDGDAALVRFDRFAARFYAQSGTWSSDEQLAVEPIAAQALGTGKVLVIESARSVAELYQPASGSGGCVPTTCAALGKTCGQVWDGCSGLLACGACATGVQCIDNVCTSSPLACIHSECATGTKLSSGCTSCAQKVCAADSYCCNTAWDGTCVNEAKSICGALCGPTCTPKSCAQQAKNCGTVNDGCGIPLSCGICDASQSCVANTCTGPASACTHSECVASTKLTVGCSACVQKVCGSDAYCCTNNWDTVCVGEAKSMCSLACP